MASNADSRFKGEWCNNKCIEIAFSDSFPTSVKDIAVQKNIINRYLNFYLGGKPQKGLTAADLTFAVISIMPLHEDTEQFLWRDIHFKDNGTMFFLTPEDKLKAEIGKIKIHEVQPTRDRKGHASDVKGRKKESKGSEDKHQDGVSNSKEVNDNDSKEKLAKRAMLVKLVNQIANEENKNYYEPRSTTSGKSMYEPINIMELKLPSNIQWYARAPKQKELELNPPKYGPVENSAFVASCKKLLEEWDANKKARIVLKYLFGIVALILMRSTTKKYTHLVNTFASNKFLSIISFSKHYLNYSVPLKNCYKYSYRTFSKKDGHVPIMFAKIVVESFHIDALRRAEKKGTGAAKQSLNILKRTVLSHTADYGFGLISMLDDIQTVLGFEELERVMKVTYCDRTAESWNRIKKFLEVYMVKTSKEATHHWARVISTEFFKDLSCNANYDLSVILGIFKEKLTGNSDVWLSAWVKSGLKEFGENIEKLNKEDGIQMYKKFESNRPKCSLDHQRINMYHPGVY